MAAPVLVLAALAAATALVGLTKPPAWLAWLPPWGVAGIAAVLAVLGTWLIEPWATRRQAVTKQERESLDLLRRHLGRQDRLPHIGEASAQALALRVHPATGLPAKHADLQRPARAPKPDRRQTAPHTSSSGLDPDLPVFVDRDKGPEIRDWMRTSRQTGGFLLLVGNSCVGKTRLLYESARQELNEFAVLAPDSGHGELINTSAEATFPLPKLIVWLDELQTFLEGPYLPEGATSITAGAIRRLLDAPTPVIILATLWPEYAHTLRETQYDPVTGQDRALYPRTLEILSGSRLHEIGLMTFSAPERTAAAELAAQDPRLAQALADRAYNVTEALAGAPELLRRYGRATETQQAVIHAAVDARRLGVQAPLTSDLLCAAARGYLTTLHPDDAWFPPALRELTRATQPQDRATAPLIPVLNDQRTGVIGHTVADYLLQHLTRQRRSTRLSAATWQALCDYPHPVDDLYRLADSAKRRLLYRYAQHLYQARAQAGELVAVDRQVDLLAEQGRTDEALDLLRPRADAGDREAAGRLVDLLAEQGRTDEALDLLRPRADAGDREAAARLVDLLAKQGRTDELWQRADAGDGSAADRLADLLAKQGRTDELWQRANAGDQHAWKWLLVDEEFEKEIEKETEKVRAAGAVPRAAQLDHQGRTDEAIDLLRHGVDAGVRYAADRLAALLAKQGRTEELRQRADAGDGPAADRLAALLGKQGRTDELRREVDAGTWRASEELIRVLASRAETKQKAERMRRFGLNPDGTIAEKD